MRSLSDNSLAKIKAVLSEDGLDIPDSALRSFFNQHRIYEAGDFVLINEGMGECSHGTILERGPNSYTVRIYGYGQHEEYINSVVDIGGISSKEEADQYFRIRSGNDGIHQFSGS